LVLEQKIILIGYKKSYPRKLKMCSYQTFDINFKVNPRSWIMMLI
jgi:hypothetical protein